MDKPLVSVSITTYNHQNYIAQAIDGVLMQKTNFDYEIIIGEDDSEDNTRAIVKEYKERYPDRIKLFLNSRENVIYVNGRPTGKWNAINNLKHARGQYIALCEGDDYWTDPNKLQKQVDFLDSNPDFAMCFHNVKVIFEDKPGFSHPFYVQDPHRPVQQHMPKAMSNLEDLLKGNFIQTPSVIFRACLFKDFPDWFYTVDRGDWPLHVLNAEHGSIAYIDEIMAAYRVHGGGVYSSMSRVEQLKGAIHVANVIDRHFNYQYHELFLQANANRLATIIELLEANGNDAKSRSYVAKYLLRYGLTCGRIRTMLKRLLKGYLPSIYRLLR